jgi:hypothetical protein
VTKHAEQWANLISPGLRIEQGRNAGYIADVVANRDGDSVALRSYRLVAEVVLAAEQLDTAYAEGRHIDLIRTAYKTLFPEGESK